MNSRNDIQRELEQLNSSLPFDAKMPVFDLPTGYFENFASGVLATVKGEQAVTASEELASLSPLLAGLSKKNPFTLPENYFEQAPALPEAEDPLPAWMQQAKGMPFAVPQGYFDGLAAGVLQQVAPPQEAKVIPMFARKWVQYAAAAVVAGFLAFGGWMYTSSNGSNPSISQPQAWVEKKLNNVSTEELEDFIETAELAGTETARQTPKSKPEVRRLLQDVPDSELEDFLNQLPAGSENLN